MIRPLSFLRKNDRRALVVLLVLAVIGGVAIDRSGVGEQSNAAASADTLSAHGRQYGCGRAVRGSDGLSGGYVAVGAAAADAYGGAAAAPERFFFDPNTADSTQLLRLGLSAWQVRSIYRYRAKGGIFRQPADFARLYGLTLKQYRELEPYIRIGADYRPAAETIAPRHDPAAAAPIAAGRDTTKFPLKLRPGQHLALNLCDTTALKRVPGIGTYYARRVVAYRERLGGYHSVTQLLEIEGFPEEALAYLRTDGGELRRLNVNRLTLSQLRRHPYIGYYQARAIVDHRQFKGPFTDMRQLAALPEFSPQDIDRLRPYVEF